VVTEVSGLNGDAPVTDAVTGAFSRASMQARLDAELSRVRRAGGRCSLLLFDVDYFKTVNDVYGHLRGDTVLRQVADRVTATIRAHDSLYRYGGDEFVVLLPDTDRAEAVALALRVTEETRATEFAGEPPLRVTISLGVASYPDDGADPDALIACADRRNYLAKRRGRGVAVADDEDTAAADTGSRLWQREIALNAVHEFLTQLGPRGRGVLRVSGEPGAGHTRFLDEVGRLSVMRGITVVPVPPGLETPPDPAATPDGPVLLVADRDATHGAAAALARFAADPDRAVVGLVYAATDLSAPLNQPYDHSVVDLEPWSPATVRIWLRSALRGEPSRTLTNWFVRQTGGLPAAAARELDRLRARNSLDRTDTGWTLSPALLGRPPRHVRLPADMTTVLGRETERRHVAEVLTGSRMVTLVGPGGVGKTRLAMCVARDLAEAYEDGVVFVPLADTEAADQVVSAIAQALDIGEVPDCPPFDSVADHLAEAAMLLVLDNLEHVLDAGPMIGQLLAAAPGVSVLATSREPVAIYGEQTYRVPPLPLPDLDALPESDAGVTALLASSPALALFHHRARAADSDFALTPAVLPDVARLCHLLDGLPLALELAAARVDRLPPPALLDALTRHLDSIGDGPRDRPQRQQTLRGTIDWSIALLEPRDQDLFATLGAFIGGCTVEAALALTGPPTDDHEALTLALKDLSDRMNTFVTKSLLTVAPDPDGRPRYRMLRTIHAYAVIRLSVMGAEPARDRHLAYFLDFAGSAGTGMAGADQAGWAVRLRAEYPNLRAALDWTDERGDMSSAGRLCLGLWRYWRNGDQIREGRLWLERVVGPRTGVPEAERLRLLYAAAVLAATQDDSAAATRLGREALKCAEATGNRPAAAQAHNILGVAAMALGRYPDAAQHFRYSLAVSRDLDDRAGMAIALGNSAKVALRLGLMAEANDHIDQCLALERAAGNSRGILLGLECQGQILAAGNDVAGARAIAEQALSLARELGDVFGEAMASHQLGAAAQNSGDNRAALRLYLDALQRRHEVGDREDLAVSLDTVAALIVDEHAELGVRVFAASQALRQRFRLATPPEHEPLRREAIRTARRTLGDRDVARAWQGGRAAPLDLVIDAILDLAD
jgi:diguanylate cyclase (GGDEF)-like protein